MFAIFPTCEPSLSRCPASFPILLRTSLPSRAIIAPTQRVQPPCLKPFQHTSRLCLTPALPHTSLPSRANAAPAQRARCAFCSSSNVQAVAAPTSPRRPRILLQPSLPSRASVSPTQRVQPPCSQPFQRTGRLCPTPVLHQTSLLSRVNAAPAQRAQPPCSQPFQRTSRLCPAAPLPRVSAVLPHASLQSRSNAAPVQRAQPPCLLSLQRASRRCHAAPRRFRYCSERLFRHAQALPPRSGCSLHVCSLFQRTSRLCLTPAVTRERCPRAAGATRILQLFQRSSRRCPHFPYSQQNQPLLPWGSIRPPREQLLPGGIKELIPPGSQSLSLCDSV